MKEEHVSVDTVIDVLHGCVASEKDREQKRSACEMYNQANTICNAVFSAAAEQVKYAVQSVQL